MTLHDKILKLYPDLPNEPWIQHGIVIQDDSDGNGAYIAKWDHPTLPRPTDEQLNGITE